MSYNSFSLAPSFNNHIFSEKFNQIDNIFSGLTGEKKQSYIPDYNLFQKDDAVHYELTVLVPGYHKSELDISVHDHQLIITGKHEHNEDKEESGKLLHSGITNHECCLSFSLSHQIEVKNATLSNGILKLEFEYIIPETEKPHKIHINHERDYIT